MMVRVDLYLTSDTTLVLWTPSVQEADAVVTEAMGEQEGHAIVKGYERNSRWVRLEENETTLSFLPKTIYLNEYVLAVEVTEHPDEHLERTTSPQ